MSQASNAVAELNRMWSDQVACTIRHDEVGAQAAKRDQQRYHASLPPAVQAAIRGGFVQGWYVRLQHEGRHPPTDSA